MTFSTKNLLNKREFVETLNEDTVVDLTNDSDSGLESAVSSKRLKLKETLFSRDKKFLLPDLPSSRPQSQDTSQGPESQPSSPSPKTSRSGFSPKDRSSRPSSRDQQKPSLHILRELDRASLDQNGPGVQSTSQRKSALNLRRASTTKVPSDTPTKIGSGLSEVRPSLLLGAADSPSPSSEVNIKVCPRDQKQPQYIRQRPEVKLNDAARPEFGPGWSSSRSFNQEDTRAKESLLDKFRQPSHNLEVYIPGQAKVKRSSSNDLTVKKDKQIKELQLLAQLKRDTSVALSHASAVEEIVGNHGLSRFYDDSQSEIIRRKAQAQIKVKEVHRSRVRLEWGVPSSNAVFDARSVVPPAEQARRLLDAKFDNISGPPLTFVNEVNHRQIDGKFQFIDSYVCGNGVSWQATPSALGCHCVGDCDPVNTNCRCFQVEGGERISPYVKRRDGITVLNPNLIESDGPRQEIIECNDACSCSKDCINRRVQKGRTIALEIFMTRRCGFGLRSPQPIKKGQFIDVYWGELLQTKDIEEYENASSEKSCSYVFSLDFFTKPAAYHVQGIHFGSPTRFINHSCVPNVRPFTVLMSHADKKIYKLAYFAIRDIPAMKEITFDYDPEAAEDGPWTSGSGEDEDVVRCLCGASACRGRVWRKHEKKGRGFARD